MKLPVTPQVYRPIHEQRRSQLIEAADRGNHKRGQDVEIGEARLILTSPDGTRYAIEVDNAGNVSASSV
jgi:predicted RecB family endonuclease